MNKKDDKVAQKRRPGGQPVTSVPPDSVPVGRTPFETPSPIAVSRAAMLVGISIVVIGLVSAVVGPEPMAWERTITSRVGELPEAIRSAFSAVMIFGTLPAALAVSVAAIWFGTREEAFFSAAAALTGYWLMLVAKEAIGRPRPTAADLCCGLPGADSPGFAFPSGHATLVGVIAVAIWAIWGRRAGIVALTTAVFVALGRVVLGEHWTMDVVTGLALGAAVGLAVFGIARPLALRALLR